MTPPPPVPGADLARLLRRAQRAAGLRAALLCTEDGLLIATAGAGRPPPETAAAIAALCAILLDRAATDLGIAPLDELNLRNLRGERFVVQPVAVAPGTRCLLVAEVEPRRPWRRCTARLRRALAPHLARLLPPPP